MNAKRGETHAGELQPPDRLEQLPGEHPTHPLGLLAGGQPLDQPCLAVQGVKQGYEEKNTAKCG